MHTHEQIQFHKLELTSCTGPRPRGLYLNLLTDQDILLCEGGNYIAHKSLPELSLLEIKGTFAHAWSFDIQEQADCFWLCFQFMGSSSSTITNKTSTGSGLNNIEYLGIRSKDGTVKVEVGAGKTSLVLLGLRIQDEALFQSEWPQLAALSADDAVAGIGYRVNRVFERIQQYADLPYSAAATIQYHICQLLEIYNKDMAEKMKGTRTEDLALYHRAISYITKHYQDWDIDGAKIAEVFHVHVRKLYRVFKSKNVTINGAIQTIRLHKGRELLRETNDSVDMIAYQVRFSTAKYFAKQFAQLFGHSPAKERELNAYSKKKLRKIQRMRMGKSLLIPAKNESQTFR